MRSLAVAHARRHGSGRVAFLLGSVLVVAGCGTSPPSGSVGAASASPVPGLSSPPGTPPSAPATPPPSIAVPSGFGVAADPSLLAFVPSGGITLTYDPDTTARVAADPTLASSARGLAIALALPAGSPGATGSASASDDLAVVNVIRLRDPSADDSWFRGWRDSYDEAACANAGGVTRRAETDIAGETVFVGSCANGSFTYHVRLAADSVVISLTSIGPARLGQSIMEGLAP